MIKKIGKMDVTKSSNKGLCLKSIFLLGLACLLIISQLSLQDILAYERDALAEAVVLADEEGALTDEQHVALSQIMFERLNRGLVGFYGDDALKDDDSLVSVIALFEHSPAEVQVLEAQVEGMQWSKEEAEAVVEDDHTLFRAELAALLASTAERGVVADAIGWEYRTALNGVSLTLPAQLVGAVAQFESVRVVYPNAIISREPVTIDDLEHGFRNPEGMAPGRQTMRADDMHALGYRGAGVVVAVLDSGIDYHHPAFEGAFLTFEEMRLRNPYLTEEETLNGYFFGRNFVDDVALFPMIANPEAAPAPNDPMETTYDFWRGTGLSEFEPDASGFGRFFTAHGTHVAGTIVGRDTGGEVAILGVAPEAYVIAYRVLGPRDIGLVDGVVAAIEQVVYDRPDVVNMSIGTPDNTPAGLPITTAVNNVQLTNPDISFVIAGGNAGPDFYTVGAPGTASTAIVVSNVIEAGYAGMTMVHEGTEHEVRFDAISGHLWQYDPALGRVVSTWEGFVHEAGVYHIFAMPAIDGIAGLPGMGTAADFEALVERYGKEALQGAFVFTLLGPNFMSSAQYAYELGLGGVIVINIAPVNDASAAPPLPVPHLFMAFDDGLMFYAHMQGEDRSTVTFSSLLFESLRLSASSSRGPVAQSFEIKPDIGANGTQVLSAVPAWWVGVGGGTDYQLAYARVSGTSMSSPHVAGAVALMIEYSRQHFDVAWEAEEIKTRLMNTAVPFEQGLYSVFETGAGYVDVFAATHAETVVFVAYDRVATVHGIAFEQQPFQTTRTGSFSFGGVNTFDEGARLDRTLTGSIVNQSNDHQTYVITSEFIQQGRLAQDPTGYATLHFSETTLSVPSGETAYFDAHLQIALEAPPGFYEGVVTVTQVDGEVVARLPFAGVLIWDPPVLQDVYLYRPVISTGEFGQNPTSRQLGLFYTPNHGFATQTSIVRAVDGITAYNWSTPNFEDAFVGFVDTTLVQEAGLTLGQPHRAVVLDGFVDQAALEEDDYFLVLEIFRQVGAGWAWEKDLLLPFSVDNTPPTLSVDPLTISAGDVVITGRVQDDGLEKAAQQALTVDIWLDQPVMNQQFNGLWLHIEDERPIRVEVDPDGYFELVLDQRVQDLPFDVTFVAIDHYSVIPRVDARLGTVDPTELWQWEAADYFALPGGFVYADEHLNDQLRLGGLFGFNLLDLFHEHVWSGLNVTEKTLTLSVERPTIPAIPPLPELPQLPSLPPLPGIPSVPGIPPLPELPSLPGVPSIPSIPSLGLPRW
ncbi:MAG: S8 family serine peptidase [Defluviitaleaceae bacterium]|nr:S8 family serine peptidase [Defluviitaleaceae bacterium]